MPKKKRRNLPAISKGKAWGNALGGFRLQRRDAAGRFGSGMPKHGPGSPVRPPSARAVAKHNRKTEKRAAKAAKGSGNAAARSWSRGLAASQRKAQSVMNSPMRKNKSTSLRHAANRNQSRFKSGELNRQVGVIPYTRHGFSSHSVGVNGGFRALPNYRISGGAYLKVQNIDKTRREKHIRDADNRVMTGLAKKIAPNPVIGAAVEDMLRSTRRGQVDKLVGGERQLGKKSFARVTTDQNSMPTVTVEYNRKASRRANGKAKRRDAIWAYNDMVTKNRGTNVTKSRDQRRIR